MYLIIVLQSCNNKKEYRYVEKVINSKDTKFTYLTKTFYSDNDTLAYIEAYRKFKASEKVSSFSKNKLRDKYNTPIGFNLFRNDSDLTNIYFKSRNKQIAKVDSEFQRFENSPSRKLAADEITRLKEQFDYKKLDKKSDLYLQKNQDWDKDVSLYGYITVENDCLKSFRLRFKGTVDDLILPYECNVIIDGKRFEINHYSLTGSINSNKEGFDDDISENSKFILALNDAKSMVIEMKGEILSTREKISEMHIEMLKEIVSTYLSLTRI